MFVDPPKNLNRTLAIDSLFQTFAVGLLGALPSMLADQTTAELGKNVNVRRGSPLVCG